MQFTKMHGAGNDYIYIDCFRETPPADMPAFAQAASDRHTGIGSDGAILIGPSEVAHARMQMWNADGSRAEMCGNGIRCVAKFVYDRNIARANPLTIETDRGNLDVWVEVSQGRVATVRVNMGAPILQSSAIPTTLPGDPPVQVDLRLDESVPTAARDLKATCVSMGNPHCVLFVDEPTDDWVHGVGPIVERHPAFPNRVNVEFAQVISPTELVVRVWERGTGETLACGTGACATTVAGALAGVSNREVLIRLPGGDLSCHWAESGDVFMTGPAVEVFTGEWSTPRIA